MIDTLGDILRNNALKFPDEIAFVYEGSRVTYSHQLNRANRLASALWKSGIRRQDRVSILSQNTLEFMETYAACELAGFIAATVNWRLAPPEIAYILKDFDARDPVLRGAICRGRQRTPWRAARHQGLCLLWRGCSRLVAKLRGLLSNWRSRGRAEPSGARRDHASDLYERHHRPAQRRHANTQGGDRHCPVDGDRTWADRFRQATVDDARLPRGLALSPACGASARGQRHPASRFQAGRHRRHDGARKGHDDPHGPDHGAGRSERARHRGGGPLRIAHLVLSPPLRCRFPCFDAA